MESAGDCPQRESAHIALPRSHHIRSSSEPPPSVLFLKQSLVPLSRGNSDAISPAPHNQEVMSLSTTEETHIMVDGEGNLRDELGFLLLPDTTAGVVTANASPVPPPESTTPGTGGGTNVNIGEAQRRAWHDFFQHIGSDTVEVLPRAELQRWEKADFSTPQPQPPPPAVAAVIEAAPAAKTHSRSSSRRRILSFRTSSKQRNAASVPLPTPPPPSPKPTSIYSSFRLRTGFSAAASHTSLTQLIRTHGIPTELRAQVWSACSGANELQRRAAPNEQYEYIITNFDLAASSPNAEQIERDLHRTFPTNYVYQKDEGIASLRQVLLAYSLRNAEVGYCQSMNFIVATLLLHMTEREAFWVLAAIVENLVPGYFSPLLVGVHVDQRVFAALVQSKFPKLALHLDRIDFSLAMCTYQWFLCLFVNALPLGTTLRIWDLFLHEGSKILFRIGLVVIRTLSRDLMACETFQDAYEVLSSGPKNRQRFAAQPVLRAAFDTMFFGSFSSKMLHELRQRQAIIVRRELNLGEEDDNESSNGNNSSSKSLLAPAWAKPVPVNAKPRVFQQATTTPVKQKQQQEEAAMDGNVEEEEEGGLLSPGGSSSFTWEFSPDRRNGPPQRSNTIDEEMNASLCNTEEGEGDDARSEGTIWSDDEEENEQVLSEDVASAAAGRGSPLQRTKEGALPPMPASSTTAAAAAADAAPVPTVELPVEYLPRYNSLRFVMSAKPASAMISRQLSQVRDEDMESMHGILSHFGSNELLSANGEQQQQQQPSLRRLVSLEMVEEEEGESASRSPSPPPPIPPPPSLAAGNSNRRGRSAKRWSLVGSCASNL